MKNLMFDGTWDYADAPPPAWHCFNVVVDIETDGQDNPRLVGLGIPGETVVCRPSEALWGWMREHNDSNQHRTSWCTYFGNADRHMLSRVGVSMPHINDAALMLHLMDENVDMSLKVRAPHHLGVAAWNQKVVGQLANPKKRDAIPEDILAEYNAHDVAATAGVYRVGYDYLQEHPQMWKVYEYISRPLQDALYMTEVRGVPLDQAKTEQYLRVELNLERARIEEEMREISPVGSVNWRSNQQVGALLYDKLGLPEHVNRDGGRSVDMIALTDMKGKHPIIEPLIRYRKVDQRKKMLEGWLKRLIDGRLHSRYNIAGPVTGRLSGEDPNPQNVPTDLAIRSLFVAPPGYTVLAADYKTLEIGGAAWQYDEPVLMAAYRGGDVHTYTATEILGRPPENKSERKKYGKSPNFRLLYQESGPSFFEQGRKDGIEWTLEEAYRIRNQWHMLYPGVRAGWRRIRNILMRQKFVDTFSGRRRRLPEIGEEYQMWIRKHAWRQGCNAVVQTPCAEFCHVAAIISILYSEMPQMGCEMILDVHDSLVFIVPTDHAMRAARLLKEIMERQVPEYFKTHLDREIPIPLFAEVAVGPSWGEAVEVDLDKQA